VKDRIIIEYSPARSSQAREPAMNVKSIAWKNIACSRIAEMYAHKTTHGGWRVADSRVSLDSVVYAYWDGKSPEAIAEEFPTLSAEQVYGAIAFYLRNREEIDEYLSQQDTKWQQLAAESEAQHGPLLERLRKSRQSNGKE
jgi:uncharacterized protein (DUF433 family)